MKRIVKLLAVAVMIPALAGVIRAATNYVGQVIQDVNQRQINGTTISTGAGTTDAGTQRVTFPTDQSPIPITGSFSSTGPIKIVDGAGAIVDVGYQVGGASVPVKVLNTVPVSQSGTWNVNAAQSGAWNVAVTTGSITAFQGGAPWDQNLTQVGGSPIALGQAAMAASVPVVIASNQTAVPISGTVTSAPQTIATVNQSSQSVTTSSTQMFASNANRKGIECINLCTNTQPQRVFCSFGAGAANTDSIIMEACSSWQPPAGIIPTDAFHCIAAAGSPVVRCTEYQNP